ncbi:glycosyltransferase [Streptomyces celluloflavus]|uniref:Glycosyltransferase n=1 Tax=Streptomyces celluloflavus TaxID=58344 RepID=A0ABW7RFG1_9ACTN
MSIEASDDFRRLCLALTGSEFPKANEDGLRHLADHHGRVARRFASMPDYLMHAVNGIRTDFDAKAADDFSASLAEFTSGGTNYIEAAAKASRDIEHYARVTATNVEYAKLMGIAQLVQMLLEIAWAILQGPYGWAEIPVFQMLTKVFLLKVFRGLVGHILAGVVISEVVSLSLDALIQRIQIANGTRDSFDSELTKQAGLSALLDGVLGGVLGAGTAKFGKVFGSSAGGKVGKTLTKNLDELGTVPPGLAKNLGKDVGGALSKHSDDILRPLGGARHALGDEAADRFRKSFGDVFEKNFGDTLGAGAARELGQKYGDTFARNWGREGTKEALAKTLDGPAGKKLPDEVRNSLKNLPDTVLDAVTDTHRTVASQAGHWLGGAATDAAHGYLSDGLYNLIFSDEHEFTVNPWSGAAGAIAGRVTHHLTEAGSGLVEHFRGSGDGGGAGSHSSAPGTGTGTGAGTGSGPGTGSGSGSGSGEKAGQVGAGSGGTGPAGGTGGDGSNGAGSTGGETHGTDKSGGGANGDGANGVDRATSSDGPGTSDDGDTHGTGKDEPTAGKDGQSASAPAPFPTTGTGQQTAGGQTTDNSQNRAGGSSATSKPGSTPSSTSPTSADGRQTGKPGGSDKPGGSTDKSSGNTEKSSGGTGKSGSTDTSTGTDKTGSTVKTGSTDSPGTPSTESHHTERESGDRQSTPPPSAISTSSSTDSASQHGNTHGDETHRTESGTGSEPPATSQVKTGTSETTEPPGTAGKGESAGKEAVAGGGAAKQDSAPGPHPTGQDRTTHHDTATERTTSDETHPGTTPGTTESVTKSDTRSGTKPDTKSDAKSATESDSKSDTKSDTDSPTESDTKSRTESVDKPVNHDQDTGHHVTDGTGGGAATDHHNKGSDTDGTPDRRARQAPPKKAYVEPAAQPDWLTIGGPGADEATHEPVPKTVHFIWLNGELSPAAQANLHEWAALAKNGDWQIKLWTDERASTVNNAFLKDLPPHVQPTLITDKLFEDPPPKGKNSTIRKLKSVFKPTPQRDTRHMYDYAHGKKGYAMASDVARYQILNLHGGIYADVDLGPGRLTLPKEPWTMPNGPSTAPFFGPELRDKKSLAFVLKRGQDEHFGDDDVQRAADEMYEKGQLGNQFIVTPPSSPFLGHLLDNLQNPAKDRAGWLYVNPAIDAADRTGPGYIRKQALNYLKEHGHPVARAVTPWQVDRTARDRWGALKWITDESESQEHAAGPPPTKTVTTSSGTGDTPTGTGTDATRPRKAPPATHTEGQTHTEEQPQHVASENTHDATGETHANHTGAAHANNTGGTPGNNTAQTPGGQGDNNPEGGTDDIAHGAPDDAQQSAAPQPSPDPSESWAHLRVETPVHQVGSPTDTSGVEVSRFEGFEDSAFTFTSQPDGSALHHLRLRGTDGQVRFEWRRIPLPGPHQENSPTHVREVTLRVRFDRGPGVGPDEAAARMRSYTEALNQHLNSGYRLPGGGDLLHIRVAEAGPETPARDVHATVRWTAADPQTPPRSDEDNWRVDDDPETWIHETLHRVGLVDEYHDSATDNDGAPLSLFRRNPDSTAVHGPDSFMGPRQTEPDGTDHLVAQVRDDQLTTIESIMDSGSAHLPAPRLADLPDVARNRLARILQPAPGPVETRSVVERFGALFDLTVRGRQEDHVLSDLPEGDRDPAALYTLYEEWNRDGRWNQAMDLLREHGVDVDDRSGPANPANDPAHGPANDPTYAPNTDSVNGPTAGEGSGSWSETHHQDEHEGTDRDTSEGEFFDARERQTSSSEDDAREHQTSSSEDDFFDAVEYQPDTDGEETTPQDVSTSEHGSTSEQDAASEHGSATEHDGPEEDNGSTSLHEDEETTQETPGNEPEPSIPDDNSSHSGDDQSSDTDTDTDTGTGTGADDEHGAHDSDYDADQESSNASPPPSPSVSRPRTPASERVRDGDSDKVSEVSEDARDEVRDEVSDEVSEGVRDEVRDESSEHVSESTRDEVRDDLSDNVSEGGQDHVSDDAHDGASDNHRDEISDEVSEDAHDEVRDDVSDHVSEDARDEVRDNVSDNVSEGTQEHVSEDPQDHVSDDAHDGASDNHRDETPDDDTANHQDETTGDTANETTNDATNDATNETADNTASNTPEGNPGDDPGDTPATTTGPPVGPNSVHLGRTLAGAKIIEAPGPDSVRQRVNQLLGNGHTQPLAERQLDAAFDPANFRAMHPKMVNGDWRFPVHIDGKVHEVVVKAHPGEWTWREREDTGGSAASAKVKQATADPRKTTFTSTKSGIDESSSYAHPLSTEATLLTSVSVKAGAMSYDGESSATSDREASRETSPSGKVNTYVSTFRYEVSVLDPHGVEVPHTGGDTQQLTGQVAAQVAHPATASTEQNANHARRWEGWNPQANGQRQPNGYALDVTGLGNVRDAVFRQLPGELPPGSRAHQKINDFLTPQNVLDGLEQAAGTGLLSPKFTLTDGRPAWINLTLEPEHTTVEPGYETKDKIGSKVTSLLSGSLNNGSSWSLGGSLGGAGRVQLLLQKWVTGTLGYTYSGTHAYKSAAKLSSTVERNVEHGESSRLVRTGVRFRAEVITGSLSPHKDGLRAVTSTPVGTHNEAHRTHETETPAPPASSPHPQNTDEHAATTTDANNTTEAATTTTATPAPNTDADANTNAHVNANADDIEMRPLPQRNADHVAIQIDPSETTTHAGPENTVGRTGTQDTVIQIDPENTSGQSESQNTHSQTEAQNTAGQTAAQNTQSQAEPQNTAGQTETQNTAVQAAAAQHTPGRTEAQHTAVPNEPEHTVIQIEGGDLTGELYRLYPEEITPPQPGDVQQAPQQAELRDPVHALRTVYLDFPGSTELERHVRERLAQQAPGLLPPLGHGPGDRPLEGDTGNGRRPRITPQAMDNLRKLRQEISASSLRGGADSLLDGTFNFTLDSSHLPLMSSKKYEVLIKADLSEGEHQGTVTSKTKNAVTRTSTADRSVTHGSKHALALSLNYRQQLADSSGSQSTTRSIAKADAGWTFLNKTQQTASGRETETSRSFENKGSADAFGYRVNYQVLTRSHEKDAPTLNEVLESDTSLPQEERQARPVSIGDSRAKVEVQRPEQGMQPPTTPHFTRLPPFHFVQHVSDGAGLRDGVDRAIRGAYRAREQAGKAQQEGGGTEGGREPRVPDLEATLDSLTSTPRILSDVSASSGGWSNSPDQHVGSGGNRDSVGVSRRTTLADDYQYRGTLSEGTLELVLKGSTSTTVVGKSGKVLSGSLGPDFGYFPETQTGMTIESMQARGGFVVKGSNTAAFADSHLEQTSAGLKIKREGPWHLYEVRAESTVVGRVTSPNGIVHYGTPERSEHTVYVLLSDADLRAAGPHGPQGAQGAHNVQEPHGTQNPAGTQGPAVTQNQTVTPHEPQGSAGTQDQTVTHESQGPVATQDQTVTPHGSEGSAGSQNQTVTPHEPHEPQGSAGTQDQTVTQETHESQESHESQEPPVAQDPPVAQNPEAPQNPPAQGDGNLTETPPPPLTAPLLEAKVAAGCLAEVPGSEEILAEVHRQLTGERLDGGVPTHALPFAETFSPDALAAGFDSLLTVGLTDRQVFETRTGRTITEVKVRAVPQGAWQDTGQRDDQSVTRSLESVETLKGTGNTTWMGGMDANLRYALNPRTNVGFLSWDPKAAAEAGFDNSSGSSMTSTTGHSTSGFGTNALFTSDMRFEVIVTRRTEPLGKYTLLEAPEEVVAPSPTSVWVPESLTAPAPAPGTSTAPGTTTAPAPGGTQEHVTAQEHVTTPAPIPDTTATTTPAPAPNPASVTVQPTTPDNAQHHEPAIDGGQNHETQNVDGQNHGSQNDDGQHHEPANTGGQNHETQNADGQNDAAQRQWSESLRSGHDMLGFDHGSELLDISRQVLTTPRPGPDGGLGSWLHSAYTTMGSSLHHVVETFLPATDPRIPQNSPLRDEYRLPVEQRQALRQLMGPQALPAVFHLLQQEGGYLTPPLAGDGGVALQLTLGATGTAEQVGRREAGEDELSGGLKQEIANAATLNIKKSVSPANFGIGADKPSLTFPLNTMNISRDSTQDSDRHVTRTPATPSGQVRPAPVPHGKTESEPGKAKLKGPQVLMRQPVRFEISAVDEKGAYGARTVDGNLYYWVAEETPQTTTEPTEIAQPTTAVTETTQPTTQPTTPPVETPHTTPESTPSPPATTVPVDLPTQAPTPVPTQNQTQSQNQSQTPAPVELSEQPVDVVEPPVVVENPAQVTIDISEPELVETPAPDVVENSEATTSDAAAGAPSEQPVTGPPVPANNAQAWFAALNPSHASRGPQPGAHQPTTSETDRP